MGDSGIPWLDIWLPKLNKMQAKIAMCLAEKFPLVLTKPQIALATGYSVRGGSFNQAVNNLVKWKLVEKTGDGYKLAEGPPG